MNLNIFKESNGAFSWRKCGTALCFLLFSYCVIGYEIKHSFDELPDGYMYLIGMVFLFYFFKKPMENVLVSTKFRSKQ